MAITHPVSGELGCKVVYYGPAASGKTTNIRYVYGRLDPTARGTLIAPTDGPDRTLFFDFLPVNMGAVRGVPTRFHLYTVPGQVPQHESRRLVLKGVDGIVFVADSHPQRMASNMESLKDLERNLEQEGLSLVEVPLVFQYNKRDLEGATPLDDLHSQLNPHDREAFEAVAIRGEGVLESLTAISRLVIASLNRV